MHRRLLPLALVLATVIAGCGSSSSKSTPAKSTTPASSTPASSTPASSTPATTAPSQSTGTNASTAATPQIGFENVPIEQGQEIAPASTTGTGLVDNLIKCGPIEQLAYHIHTHLAVYVNGQPRQLPGGIGIPGSQVQNTSKGPVAFGGQCIYWLHTHAPDGVIHVESPTHRVYTLGQFFDEWHQPLSSAQIGSITGTATWIVNGRAWTKDPRQIPLLPRENIQANVGQPAAPYKPINWSVTQL